PRRLRTPDGSVRIAVVAAQALLLAGDDVRIDVVVDGPHRVDIIETGGTVAYDMRGGRATWSTDLTLRNGADVTWHAEPFVISNGAYVDRTTTADVEADCRLTLREVLVFGRTGETGGTLRTSTRLSQDGRSVVAEDLDLARSSRESSAILNGRRSLDTITTLGHRLHDGFGVLQSDGDASISRWMGDELHLSDQAEIWARSFHGRPVRAGAQNHGLLPGSARPDVSAEN
ncbi:MAG: urease accessory protein UreD, partial [Solirubrobacteraceae bacterium]|nr:urease accessory protein UreD [Solirubrobacteraceae bacterium]